MFCCILGCLLFLICIEFVYSYFPVLVLFVSISQVIGCEDRLRNDLYYVEWGVKLYSNSNSMGQTDGRIALFQNAPWEGRGIMKVLPFGTLCHTLDFKNFARHCTLIVAKCCQQSSTEANDQCNRLLTQGPWVWSGRVRVVEFSNDTTRPDQRRSMAGPV